MSQLRAHVENGRLVLNEPTARPDGTVLDLVMDDAGDEMNDEEREALISSIREHVGPTC